MNQTSKSLFLRLTTTFLTGFLFVVLLPISAQQSLRFERIDRVDGLSQSSVNCMLKDKEGFMWFGTQDGLNLYDGRKFKVFQNNPGDESSLSNNYILSICEDEDSYIWVGTMAGGLNQFDKHTGTFKIYQHNKDSNSISENTVWTVLSDGKGLIWAGTSEGLNRFEKKTGQFISFRSDPADSSSLFTDMVVSLYRDSRDRMWVGTVEGLCLFNDKSGKFIRFRNEHELELPGANIIWSISEAPGGEMIIGTNDGVYLLNIATRDFTRILGGPGQTQLVAWTVNPKQSGIIWVGSDRGLFRVEIPRFSSQAYLYHPDNLYSIADNNVWCLLFDPAGFLWTGTNNGICKAKTTGALFKLAAAEPGQWPALSSSKITSVLEDRNGNLWVGTDGGGLNCINPGRDNVKVYNSVNSALRNDNVWALAESHDGMIYIGNYQGGLHRYDPGKDAFYAYPMATGEPNSLPNRRVLALMTDKEGNVWIGTRGSGLCRLDPNTGIFEVFQNDEKDTSGFPANTVLSIAQDSTGRIWAGTQEGGLALYLPETNKFKTFKHIPGEGSSLSDNNVWALEVDRQGRLWAGTQGGLNVVDNPGEDISFRYFTTKDGLRNNYILALEQDAEGNIWMSSFNGIAKLDMKIFESPENTLNPGTDFPFFSPLFSLFDTDHGLQDLEFNHGCCCEGRNGMVYFGGNNGLNYFVSAEVQPSSYEPPLLFTDIKIFNKDVSILPDPSGISPPEVKLSREGGNYGIPVGITFIKHLILSYRESVVSFEFISLDYSNPVKNRYAYKLDDFDENWNYVGSQNQATYTNLDPGKYTLRVRGSNSDGVWNPEEVKMEITIVPPFWKTAWFIVLSAFVIIMAIFLSVRRAFLVQRRKARMEKELIELQLKTIKSQIDPHFAFNALNTIASLIYSDNPDLAYDYFTRFAMMIRNILEDNDKISRPLKEEIEFVQNYLELQKMRFKDKFEYAITVDPAIAPETLVPKMMIQSYAENAIKHGLMHRKADGLLTIQVRETGPSLIAVIEDNGIGRMKAAQMNLDSTRKGFRIMEQIIELYRKLYHHEISQAVDDLMDENGEPAGTRVTLTITHHSGQNEERNVN